MFVRNYLKSKTRRLKLYNLMKLGNTQSYLWEMNDTNVFWHLRLHMKFDEFSSYFKWINMFKTFDGGYIDKGNNRVKTKTVVLRALWWTNAEISF